VRMSVQLVLPQNSCNTITAWKQIRLSSEGPKMSSFPRWLLAVMIAATAFATLAAQAEEHRELGAHEHGRGTLNIAIEGAALTMVLEVPGDDIVGFEHEAVTPSDKAALEVATAAVGKPLALFKMPAAAECTLTDAKVDFAADDEHDAGKVKANIKSGDPAPYGDHGLRGSHKEFHATYTIACAVPAALTTVDFEYFKVFAGAKRLTVNVITAKGQSAFEVSREKPHLDLSGLV
jgi:hypothetical protein